jgi:hypothetical protein
VVIKNRWVRVGLVALAIFLINALSRLISNPTTSDTEKAQAAAGLATGAKPIALIGVGALVLLMVAAGAWWGVRYPFQRLFFDLGAAAVVGALLSLLVAPFVGGSVPFDEGLGTFVGEFLQFVGLAALGVFLGFVAMIAFGKDWKSRGLRRYEENYRKKHPGRQPSKR